MAEEEVSQEEPKPNEWYKPELETTETLEQKENLNKKELNK